GSGQAAVAAAIKVTRLLAACLLVAALGTLMYGVAIKRGGYQELSSITSTARPDGLPDQRGLLTLASLKLPVTCLPANYRPLTSEQAALLAAALADESRAALRCCTECHYAGVKTAAGARIVALVAANCQACHRG